MNWRPPLRGCHAPTRPRHSGWPDASFPAWPPWTPRPGSAVTEGATADLEDNLPSRLPCGGLRAGGGAGYRAGMTPAARSPYAGHRFPPEVISHAVWLYFRFPLALRMVE